MGYPMGRKMLWLLRLQPLRLRVLVLIQPPIRRRPRQKLGRAAHALELGVLVRVKPWVVDMQPDVGVRLVVDPPS